MKKQRSICTPMALDTRQLSFVPLGKMLLLVIFLVFSFSPPIRIAKSLADPGHAKTQAGLTLSGCAPVPELPNLPSGWGLQICTTDSNIPIPMDIWVNGVFKGKMAAVIIYHQSQNFNGSPQVAVIYASGYIRLKQNADPSTPIPFGASFILGPAYWSQSTLHNNPQLTRLDINTTWLANGPLLMKAQGRNHDFAVSYDMTMPPPRDRQTRIHVNQIYTATTGITIDPSRKINHEGFKLIQISSMFIKDTDCIGGYTNCHDSNAVRYIGNDLIRHEVAFTGPMTFYFGTSPKPLGSTWIDVLHTDDKSWQGNTPNVRIALDRLPSDRTITPQGNVGSGQQNPNNGDNVSLWLHDDGPDSVTWQAGRTSSIGYWLIAQDNPPDPWADLGLRSGLTFVNFEGNYQSSYNCYFNNDQNQDTTGTSAVINGYKDKAFEINYDLRNANYNWVQIRCDFSQPLNLSAYDHLRFEWRGSPTTNPDLANSLQVGMIDVQNRNHFVELTYHHAAHHTWWGQFVIPFSAFAPSDPPNSTLFDPAHVKGIFFSVVKMPNDIGGAGRFAIDNVSAFNVGSRSTPNALETVNPSNIAAQAAAGWLAQQQQANGSLRSWAEEEAESPYHKCLAHTYDQALGLIVFSKHGMWNQADRLVDRLVATQNPDGTWYQTRTCTGSVDNLEIWVGDISWTIYALSRYLNTGGTHMQAQTALQRGSDWLAQRVSTSGPWAGCLKNSQGDIEGTEATLDAWWAFQATGARRAAEADKIKRCLTDHYWDDVMGRFNGGNDPAHVYHVYLDNQTWGAAFLKAIGENKKALRALSYARDVLREPAQGGQLFGFDGNAGPWSVWNEGTAQYIAAGGNGANDALLELLAQQEKVGALVGSLAGSPDNFSGSGVWTTRWHGVAPTAWFYFALTGEPFHAFTNTTDVYIGANKQATYNVPFHQSIKASYAGVDKGPVKIVNSEGIPFVASERVAYSPNGGTTWTSYSELMGLPANQLTTSYTFPWYNNVDLNSQLRFGNVGSTNTNVTVTVGGVVKGTYNLAPNASQRVSYVGLDKGPVKVTSSGNVPIIASLRVAYFNGSKWTSFSEMMGLPSNKLTTGYIFPWYNNVDLNSQLRFGNVGTSPTTVTVTIGGVFKGAYNLAPNASQRISYPALDGGPVKVTSSANVPIIASLRVAYHNGSAWTDFSELMGLPIGSLSTRYSFPIYNNVNLNTQLRFANVGNTTTTVTVTIGGVVKSSYILAPNESKRVSYAGVDSGPVVIQSSGNVPIIASERVAYFNGSAWTSFAEMMGLPQSQLTTTYLFPWYNNIDINTQLRFGVP